ncbi:ATP synthase F0 subunit B [Puniceibacterium sediminis]|uniref:ATP synthase subunit b n=1 Tax=Puniceibacterium sediminis TaxID=1608407 RepID=A0A238XXF2_9RHOB|nr:ATP synthase F0 subunit B [Puniceibacterium sediminis]SNR63756.1 ATP synthase F0 subcomplex B subunit [Puniceibacterium sediminis]
MTIDLWGIGLQAINVLILVWLLSRVLWRPVAGAIAARQEKARAVIDDAQATQANADAAMAEVTKARADIGAERTAALDAARAEADTAARAALAEARTKAEAILATAKSRIAHETEATRKANAVHAADLSLEIAAKLLGQLNSQMVQSAFLSQLIEAISKLSAADRAALVSGLQHIDVVSATDAGADKDTIEKAICDAFGSTPNLRFVTDPDLIAGLELHSAHFTLRNSWQADLARIRKAVQDAA